MPRALTDPLGTRYKYAENVEFQYFLHLESKYINFHMCGLRRRQPLRTPRRRRCRQLAEEISSTQRTIHFVWVATIQLSSECLTIKTMADSMPAAGSQQNTQTVK